jgi:hypothetical protein
MGCVYGTHGRDEKYVFTDAFLVRNREGQRPIKRHRRGYDDNIRMDFTGIGYGVLD